ncbi:hypothetical protein SADUNF_Sadunf03G0115800 [Salix dunnii]|uniref:Uncharacterized protein n=1 Tax=Salix dunnii TaxID=1413687 RepID=A0A835TGZ3_9ROSI|nr:hypothetical protein SADUNF_Sadunf03G0115800 [Salix dunnii]
MDCKTLFETLKDATNSFSLPFLGGWMPSIIIIIIIIEFHYFILRGGGASQDQSVKKRKNGEYEKCAKKMKMMGEENENIEEENENMLQMLRKIEAEIKQQKADFYASLNEIISEHESRVGALLQEPLVQDLLPKANELELAQGVMLSPKANSDARVPSEDELKNRFEILSKVIEVLCKVMTA